MKKITIPKRFGYPTLDIVVNGIVHTVESGKEIEVEDHIAEAIENAIALAPVIRVPKSKFAQLAEDTLNEMTADDLAGITTLTKYCFYYANYLKAVTLPDSIAFIDNYAFGGCWRLATIYLPETPPTLASSNAFDSIPTTAKFICKTEESLAAYRSAPEWGAMTRTYTFVVE